MHLETLNLFHNVPRDDTCVWFSYHLLSWASEGGRSTNSPPHVLKMGVSYRRQLVDGTINSTQSNHPRSLAPGGGEIQDSFFFKWHVTFCRWLWVCGFQTTCHVLHWTFVGGGEVSPSLPRQSISQSSGSHIKIITSSWVSHKADVVLLQDEKLCPVNN